MNVYLYGISGVYNYGCEAMVRAISVEIKKKHPLANIVYKTYDYEYDVMQLADCEAVVVSKLDVHAKEKSLRHKLQRGKKYITKKLGIANDEDRLPYNTKWLKECDYLVIIGGDVFDLIPGRSKKYDNERIWASKVAKKNRSKIILWGISVGDFESDKLAKKTMIDYFKNIVDVAIIRDRKSLEYLKKNGIKNVYLCADPAFMLRGLQTTVDSNYSVKTLGVNLSPLANRYLKHEFSQEDWSRIWSEILSDIYKRYNYKKIILLSHVVNEDKPSDDDYGFLIKIAGVLEKKGVNVEMTPRNTGFVGIKQYLARCNLVLSARMHCCVNAITCGVPTVFLSYSSKSIGMCELVYGNMQYVIEMDDLLEKVDYELFDKINNSCDDIRQFLSVRNKELNEMSKYAMHYFDMEEI